MNMVISHSLAKIKNLLIGNCISSVANDVPEGRIITCLINIQIMVQ